jgi:hypothetical protein
MARLLGLGIATLLLVSGCGQDRRNLPPAPGPSGGFSGTGGAGGMDGAAADAADASGGADGGSTVFSGLVCVLTSIDPPTPPCSTTALAPGAMVRLRETGDLGNVDASTGYFSVSAPAGLRAGTLELVPAARADARPAAVAALPQPTAVNLFTLSEALYDDIVASTLLSPQADRGIVLAFAVDPSGARVAGETASLPAYYDTARGSTVLTAQPPTGSAGLAALIDLPPGDFAFDLARSGHVTTHVVGVPVVAGDLSVLFISVR